MLAQSCVWRSRRHCLPAAAMSAGFERLGDGDERVLSYRARLQEFLHLDTQDKARRTA